MRTVCKQSLGDFSISTQLLNTIDRSRKFWILNTLSNFLLPVLWMNKKSNTRNFVFHQKVKTWKHYIFIEPHLICMSVTKISGIFSTFAAYTRALACAASSRFTNKTELQVSRSYSVSASALQLTFQLESVGVLYSTLSLYQQNSCRSVGRYCAHGFGRIQSRFY